MSGGSMCVGGRGVHMRVDAEEGGEAGEEECGEPLA